MSNEPEVTGGRPVALRPAERFRAYARNRADLESAGGGGEISAQQADKILAAETADDIMNADTGGTVQARDAVGMEVEIKSLRFNKSNRPDIQSEYYGSMDATCLGGPKDVLNRCAVSVGEDFVLQTGAELILVKVRALEAKGFLPVQAVIKGITTSNGTEVLKLAPMPERTVQGEHA